ncbi:MAG: histidine kinase dimerization/phospho-acceptor domain-containing protein [Pseudomonadota bacterium]
MATQTEVTERIEASVERDRLQDRMVRALTATEDAFLLLEPDGCIAFANTAVGRFFPVPGLDWAKGSHFTDNWDLYLKDAEDLPGKIPSILIDPDFETLAQLPAGQEVDLPDGLSVLIRAAVLRGGGFVVSATDVTAMKSAQHLLSQRLAAIEAATDGIAVTDEVGRLLYQNTAAARLMGFKSATSGLGRQWQGRYASRKKYNVAKGFETTLTRTINGQVETHEISGSPIAAGGSVIIIRDITNDLVTEAREAELMRELVRLQRQEAIAQLTAGVAHDFNNLLSAINGSATLIGMTPLLPQDVHPHLERITKAGAQSAKLISQLLDVGAASDAAGAFDLSSILADLPALLTTNLPKRVQFDIVADQRAIALQGASGTLSQILINMILNASDAIGDTGGTITLHVSNVTGANVPQTAVGTLQAQGKYVCIAIKDTGDGMDAETTARVHDPSADRGRDLGWGRQ